MERKKKCGNCKNCGKLAQQYLAQGKAPPMMTTSFTTDKGVRVGIDSAETPPDLSKSEVRQSFDIQDVTGTKTNAAAFLEVYTVDQNRYGVRWGRAIRDGARLDWAPLSTNTFKLDGMFSKAVEIVAELMAWVGAE